MITAIRSRFRRAGRWIESELEYAQQRSFETRSANRRGKRSQAELDALYAVPPSKRPLPR